MLTLWRTERCAAARDRQSRGGGARRAARPVHPNGRSASSRRCWRSRRSRASGSSPCSSLTRNTQLLGLCLGVGLALLASALIACRTLAGAAGDEGRGPPDVRGPRSRRGRYPSRPRAGLDGITRRRLIGGAAGIAGAGLTAAVVIPVVALGPGSSSSCSDTPWRAGRALVDDEGNPILAANVNEGSFVTAFPAGCGQGQPRIARRRRAGRPRDPAAAAQSGLLGAAGDPRLLEDLHARGVRDLAVPLPAEPDHPVARPGAGVPVPLLDVRRARRRQRGVRPRRPCRCRSCRCRSTRPVRSPRAARCRARRPVLVGRPPVSKRSSRPGDGAVDAVSFVDERLGAARGLRFLMDYVFPDHWSFLLGEIALYSFVILILTGTFLALFFDPSTAESDLPRRLRRAAGPGRLGRLRLDAAPLLRRLRRPVDAPDPPLGGARVRRGDHAAPAADHLHRRVSQAPRHQLLHRR